MHLSTLLLPALLLLGATAFSLEGTWVMQDTRLTISDLVYRNSTLLSKLAFAHCSQAMLLQAQVSHNMLFLNLNSQLLQPNSDTSHSCSRDDSATALSALYGTLSRVFYFQINLDQLLLQDPYGSTLLTFRR